MDYEATVVAQINAIKEKNLILIAHSIGGVLLLRLAEQFSARVVGLVGMSANDVLAQEEYHHKYGGGWLLLREVSSAYNSENTTQGFIAFVKDLQRYKNLHESVTISETALAIIEEREIRDEVFQRFDAQFANI